MVFTNQFTKLTASSDTELPISVKFNQHIFISYRHDQNVIVDAQMTHRSEGNRGMVFVCPTLQWTIRVKWERQDEASTNNHTAGFDVASSTGAA